MTKNNTGGFLGWVERVGNKLPHPVILFMFLMGIEVIISFIMKGAVVINPSTQEEIVVKSLLSTEGGRYILTNMLKNFVGFAPLGLVLAMTLGIGLAEEIGLMSAFMKKTILGVSDRYVIFMIMLVGICGNMASDAAIIIVPTLSAIIYLYLGKNPIAGIALGYAATSAGFSANLVIAGTDALLQGITNQAADIVNAPHINVTANWFFMIASTFLIAIIGVIVNKKIVEPRLGQYNGNVKVEKKDITENELAGLKSAGISLFIYLAVIFLVCLPKNSFMRNPDSGSLVTKSTLLSGIIPLIMIMFIIISVTYGIKSKVIKKPLIEIPKIMEKSISKMSGFILLAFIIGNFIGWFNWSNIGLYLAIKLAYFLESTGFVGIPLFIFYVLICTFINLFIGSGSSKWALLAPIFVPMMFVLGYDPAWTQLLYRIGDSSSNIITPLFPYFPIILNLMNEYDNEVGAGTLISTMMPYSIIILVVWIIFAIFWYAIGLPLGI